MDYNITLDSITKKHGNRVIKIFSDRNIQLTYNDIHKYSLQLACWLLEQGLQKGDCFAIWMGNVPEFVLLTAASLRIGTVIVPISPYESIESTADICGEYRCKYVFYDSQNKYISSQLDLNRDALKDIPAPCLDIADNNTTDPIRITFSASAKLRSIQCELNVHDDIIISHTSGSTGQKKGVRKSICSFIGEKGLSKQLYFFLEFLNIVYPVRLFNLCPWHHTAGMGYLFFALMGGFLPEITVENYHPLQVLDGIKKYKPNLWQGTATMLYRCCTYTNDTSLKLPAFIFSTGEPLSYQILAKLQEYPGGYMLNTTYGSTEAGPIAGINYTLHKLPLILRFIVFIFQKLIFPFNLYDIHNFKAENCAGILGDIASNVDIIIFDDQKKISLSDGDIGEICASTPTIMNGYFGETSDNNIFLKYNDKLYIRTGDLGYKSNERLFLSGRKKNMIIRSGENILPVEIEQIAQNFPGVDAAVVCGIPSKEYGEDICLCLQADQNTLDLAELQNTLRNSLPKYMYPEHFLFWDQFPTTASGKTDVLNIRQEIVNKLNL